MDVNKVIGADVVAGTQMAIIAAVATLLKHVSEGNPQVRLDLEAAVEHTKAMLLASSSTEEKCDAFESVASALLRSC